MESLQAQIDPIVPPGTPGTVTLPQTGHVLSVPRPDLGEMFVGYCTRVSAQCGGNKDTVGALFSFGDAVFSKSGGYKADGTNWPVTADRFFSPILYLTDAEKAQTAAGMAEWDKAMANIGKDQSTVNQSTVLTTAARTPDAQRQRQRIHENRKHQKAILAGVPPAQAPAPAPPVVPPSGDVNVPIQ
jgi:hypothetical protein